jgi:hypothetical protein
MLFVQIIAALLVLENFRSFTSLNLENHDEIQHLLAYLLVCLFACLLVCPFAQQLSNEEHIEADQLEMDDDME